MTYGRKRAADFSEMPIRRHFRRRMRLPVFLSRTAHQVLDQPWDVVGAIPK
jgi:hypothetical protein